MNNYKIITLFSLIVYSQFYNCQDDWTTFPAENNGDSIIVDKQNNDTTFKLLNYNSKLGNINIENEN